MAKRKKKKKQKIDIKNKKIKFPPIELEIKGLKSEDKEHIQRMYRAAMELSTEYRQKFVDSLPKIPRGFLSEVMGYTDSCRKEAKELAKELQIG